MKTFKIENILTFSFLIISVICLGQQKAIENFLDANIKIRHLEDSIGFPQYKWQMDSSLSRITAEDKVATSEISKAVTCPHDDYGYAAGSL